MEKLEKVLDCLEKCTGSGCMGCEYADITGGFDECMGALMKDALKVIKDLREKLKTAKDGRLELGRRCRELEEKVHPDWYERLEKLDYNYDPVKDGSPWYRAEDVWACIEEVAE